MTQSLRPSLRSTGKAVAAAALAGLALAWFVIPGAAQSGNTFKGRLSKVPVDAKMVPVIIGDGTATGTLAGTRLTISGTFQGLGTPATEAKLHTTRMRGTRGPAIADLTVSKAASGAISGTVNLTAEQVNDLRAGKIYVQIQSEKGPEGHLWGWLLP
jgi:hypothetical protein